MSVRKIRPGEIWGGVQVGVSTGAVTNTVALNGLMAPSANARISRWGISTRVAGTGTGTFSVTLRERGIANNLAPAIVWDGDTAAPTYQSAENSGTESTYADALVQGRQLDAVFTESGDVTGAGTVDIWVVWQT